MTVSAWIAVAFVSLSFVQRVWETFASRAKVPGRTQMTWSLHALSITYTLIVMGSIAECLLLRRAVLLWVSLPAAVLHVAAFVLREVAIRTLGKLWSFQIEIRTEHKLVCEGVYRYVRHPAYTSVIVEVLTLPLIVNAWWMFGFAMLTHLPLVALRIHHEEKALVDKFGEAYRQYQRTTGALFPCCSRTSGARGGVPPTL